MDLIGYTLPDDIFIDANIWSYFALRNPKFQKDCTQFLERVEQSQISGVTSNFVLNEVLHVILIGKGSEILQTDKIWKIKEQLKKDAALSAQCYKACTDFLGYVNVLKAKGLRILDIGYDVIATSPDLGKSYKLLGTDALHLATCKAQSIKHLATNDSDFDNVDILTVWKPQSVPVASPQPPNHPAT
ncbi:MAG: PIN domain-containing protein [Chloroflexi bacterium]|nr:PIN domain-containing protein [Chloroflexota bacterium]